MPYSTKVTKEERKAQDIASDVNLTFKNVFMQTLAAKKKGRFQEHPEVRSPGPLYICRPLQDLSMDNPGKILLINSLI